MSIMKDSTIFIIDGSKAISGTGANFNININMPKGKNYNRVCLLQAIIPKSYFLCTTGENTFILSENGNTTVTVTQGSYNAISWTILIGNLLTSSSTAGWTYTITLPDPRFQVDTAMFTYLRLINTTNIGLCVSLAHGERAACRGVGGENVVRGTDAEDAARRSGLSQTGRRYGALRSASGRVRDLAAATAASRCAAV